MAHVPGVPLAEYTAAERRTVAQVLDLALQIADGLAHAHKAGVVHRDLKPSNILVDDAGRARILDFGIASQQGASRLTMTGFTIGTLAYTPPEVIEGKDSTPASDLYSLGVVLYQMLTARLPHEADHDAALLYAILHDAPKPLAAHRADVPADVPRIVVKCLEKAHEKRYADARELIEDLRAARRALAADTERPAASERPSIAVLPFANMSADSENEYFSDGLTEELLNVLAKNPALKVTGRTSSFAFKGKLEDLRDIGQKLGVATLLEGSVRKAGNRVRITAQLIKAEDGFHLWSETYDRVVDDIFAVQDDIAQAVSAALDVTLLGKTAPATRNPRDYALFLQAKHFTEQMSRDSVARAVALFRELLARSPRDAGAWAVLGRAYAVQGSFGFADADASTELARDAAAKALELDPACSEAHEILGWLEMNWDLRWAEAGASFRKAHQLSPGSGGPRIGLAVWHASQGDFETALPFARSAIELEPLSPTSFQFIARFRTWAGDYEGAIQDFSKAIELSPSVVAVHAGMAVALLLLGRLEQALAVAGKEASQGYRDFALSCIHFTLGNEAESRASLDRLVAGGDSWAAQIAFAYAWRGEADEAFEWIERGRAAHDTGLASLKVHPLLRKLHADPRWEPTLVRLGFTP
jgi:serine/threonine-protein kinase